MSDNFGATLRQNLQCQLKGKENLGAVMHNDEVKVTCSKSLVHFHSNTKCELELESSRSSTVLASEGLKLKFQGAFSAMDIRMASNSTVNATESVVIMQDSSDIKINDAYYSDIRIVGSTAITVECPESRVIAHRTSNSKITGVGLTAVIQDSEDIDIDGEDFLVYALKTRRLNVTDGRDPDEVTDDGNGYFGRSYVVAIGIDDFNVSPTIGDSPHVNWIHFVPSTEDSNESPSRVDVRYVHMAHLSQLEFTLGIFHFWKQKKNGDEAKKNNIFQLTFDKQGIDIQSLKVVQITEGSKAKFEATRRGAKQYLEVEGNIIGMSEDGGVLYFSTNVKK